MENKITYQQYRKERQNSFNELPIFYAFSNEQFIEAMKQRGLDPEKDCDKLYRTGAGGFYLKSDSQKIQDWIANDKIDELMNDKDFAVSAFYYEMCNHEYGINYYQGNYDVLSCFYDVEYNDSDDYELYFDELKLNENIRSAYKQARKKYFANAEANDWF